MALELPRTEARTPTAQVVALLEEFGAVVVEDLLEPELLARLNAELDAPLAEAKPEREFVNPAIAWFFGKRTRHLTAVASHSRTFADEVLTHPRLLEVCDAILLPSCARYQLNVAHVLDRGPGAEAQLLHRDELVWVHMPRPHPELQVATIIALADFDEENGATRVVPGSHRWPLEREAEPSELAVARMKRGSAVIYLGSTLHQGGANTTKDRWRRGMHMSYVLGWLRTEENNYLGTPPAVARTLSRRAQELLGYAAHDAIAQAGGYLGAVDLRDPVDLLAEGTL
jgi:ectoine hydroxylase-related dioxygenase (phytanoyl-CoA dioxygenase family)